MSYTTLLTYDRSHVSPFHSPPFSTLYAARSGDTYFKKPLQPPDLKDALPNQDSQLKYTPPFDPSIRAFSSIAVGAFTDNDVRLFILDLIQELGELFNCRTHTRQSVSHSRKPMRCPNCLELCLGHRSIMTLRLTVHKCRLGGVGHTFNLQWITRRLALWHIHNPVHIEADLLRARRPSFIAEAVYMFTITSCVEGMIAGGDSLLINQVVVRWANNL